MTTDVALHQPSDLAQQMEYARVVSSGSLLPQAYRGKPADILIAIGLGQAMGLSPAESLYRIDVIQGKPTASAELISANVRKAGHKLRVTGDDTSATATIVRHDDPDFEFTATRDAAWAQRMGLNSKDNYKKQPGTMLQWRAISAVARLACPEALYGVAYTPDEMRDVDHPASTPATRVTADDFVKVDTTTGEVLDGEVTPAPQAGDGAPPPSATPAPTGEVEAAPSSPRPRPGTEPSAAKRAKMFASFADAGFTSDPKSESGRRNRLAYIAHAIGREVETSNELNSNEVGVVIAMLEADAQNAAEPGEAS